MFKTILIGILLSININASYGAISKKEECNNLKQLPIISKKFYKKFKDAETTLALYNEYSSLFYNQIKLPCLSNTNFNKLLKEYAHLKSLTSNYRTLDRLVKNFPQKTFLLKDLGDVYRRLYISPEKQRIHNKEKYRLQALENYDKYIKKGGKSNKVIKSFLKNRGLHKAKNRWFNKFSIDKVPTGSYKVIYFNSNFPNKVVKESIVPYPAVNYASDKFPGHKLPSEDFAAYWVGDIVFDKDVEKTLNLRVSWSEYRLIIDGYEVSKGNRTGAEVPYLFTKGKHRIEVEYLNNYGATDFTMTMYDKREYIETSEITKYLSGDYLLFYVGLYESNNFDNTLDIKIKKKYNKPIILLVNSYGNIDWKINPNGNNIKAIFVSSYSRGSIVSLKKRQSTKVHYLKNFNRAYSLRIKCRCDSTYNTYCQGSSLLEFDSKILGIFNKHLDGFTTFYSRERAKNKTYIIPKVLLTKKIRKKIKLEEKKVEQIKQECEKEKNLGIDDIF